MMTTSMTAAAASADVELVNASLAGSREAFGQIVSRYQSLVCSLAYSATGSLSQREDLAQETFLTAWKNLAELREPAKLRSWLCGIARNLSHNSLRAQGREPSHHAESLDEIPESRSPEPLPVELAISQEEAEILWRALERIPETYRVPLILFYREHESVVAVAQNLELTEDAVRQRLSRGRKLLQAEVLAFVEGALEKTAPGKAFAVAVVAALPLAVTSAKAASVGIAVGKSGVGAKSLLSLGPIAGFLSMLGAFLFWWKTGIDDTKSLRERKFVVRTGFYQFIFFALSVGAAFYWLPTLSQRPWVFASALALLLLANVAIGVWGMTYVLRRRMEIGMEEGTLWETLPGGPQEDVKSKALRKTIKLTIPFLLMFAVGAIGLPWRQHWVRSAAVVAGLALVIFWFFWRTRRQLSFQTQPRFSGAFMRHPVIGVAVILFGIALLASMGGYLLPFFLHPEAARSGIPAPAWLRPFGLCLLFALLACAGLAAVFFGTRRKIVPPGIWLARKFDLPFLKQLRTLTGGPGAIVDVTYAPLFEQLNFGSDKRAQLKDLVLKRTMVGVRAGIPLMNSKLDTAKRAALTQQIRSETDAANAQIRELLGGESYVAFQDFERTIPDRTMLDQFNRRSAKTAAELSPEQQARLLQALTEARGQYPWTTDLSRRNQGANDYAALFSGGNLETFVREEEQFDRQFLAWARHLLNPEQLMAFEDARQRQLRSQIAQFEMAVKLFAPRNC